MGRIIREFPGLPHECRLFDPVNVSQIKKDVEACVEDYKDDEVSVNISGGTKPWTVIFSRYFADADLFYIDQNNVLTHINSGEVTNVPFNMEVDFRLHGNELLHYTPLTDYTDEDKHALPLIEAARNFNTGQFNKLTTVLTPAWKNMLAQQDKGCFTLPGGASASWDKKKGEVVLSLNLANGFKKSFQIRSPHAVSMAFNSGWFEYKMAQMISHWNRSVDIRLNCIFPPVTYRLPNSSLALQYPKNEIDIIVNTGKKCLFVECKTNISSSTDIDKFRTAVKNYGGMGSKALFLTDNKKTELQLEKCYESGMMSFALKDTSHGPCIEEDLFRLLDNQLLSINER